MTRSRHFDPRNLFRPAPLRAVALAVGLVGSALLLPALPASAQVARAYAPERLWELTPAEQRRVIGNEYADQSGGRRIPEDQMRFYLDQVRLSRWTFSQVRNDIATSLNGNGAGGGNWPPSQGGSIRCESSDNRQHTCNTPWSGTAELVRQLSNSPCIEGQTWSSSPGRVWVRNGCRGEFAESRWGGGGGNGQQIRCESDGGRYRQCGTGLYGNVRLIRQISGSACAQGRTWGLRGGSIWVSGGCRGLFEVYGNGGGWGGNGGDYSVTCASKDGRYTTCAWDRSRGWPRLQQQLSDSACVEGRSWGYDRGNTLWVDRGCRGRFGVR